MPKLIIMSNKLLGYLANREKNQCNVCGLGFKDGDRVMIGRQKNTKHYHEDCFGRLLH